MNRYILIILGVVLLLASVLILVLQWDREAPSKEKEEELVMADKYECDDGVVLDTLFHSDGSMVEFTLPSGRTLLLEGVVSTSSASYESGDGLVVLKIEGEEATLKTGDKTIEGCRAVADTETSE
ncbi:MAG: MliC family protein [Candidatus Paceibacterota bacterium]